MWGDDVSVLAGLLLGVELIEGGYFNLLALMILFDHPCRQCLGNNPLLNPPQVPPGRLHEATPCADSLDFRLL